MHPIMMLLIAYGCMINGLGFVTMGLDKRKARKEQWRVPERNFFIIALLGGSLGCWLGMQWFHHKTLHKRFAVGIPMIFIVQVFILVVVIGNQIV